MEGGASKMLLFQIMRQRIGGGRMIFLKINFEDIGYCLLSQVKVNKILRN